MIINSFLSKNNTIVKNSKVNTGKNPVIEMFYGGDKGEFSRYIFQIDLDRFKLMYDEYGYFNNYETVEHRLRMTNTSFFDYRLNGKSFLGKERATSFKLKLYRIDKNFAEGIGYDFHRSGFTVGKNIYDEQPSNYFKATAMDNWNNDGAILNNETEIFAIEKRIVEDPESLLCIPPDAPEDYIPLVEKYFPMNDSLLIAEQTFYVGNENIDMDITNYIIGLSEEWFENNGLCLCFESILENTISDNKMYVGFFSRHSNSIYSPLVQSIDFNVIKDDRLNFQMNKLNRLYFYVQQNGKYVDLPFPPTAKIMIDPDGADDSNNVLGEFDTCIEDATYKIYKQRKGIYYIEVQMSDIDSGGCTALYDVWQASMDDKDPSNGDEEELPKTELSFTLKNDSYTLMGIPNENKSNQLLYLAKGINNGSRLNRGDLRDFYVLPKIKYTYGQYDQNIDVYYNLYCKEGNAEIPIFEHIEMDSMYDGSKHILIDTMSLLPNKYFIDLIIYRNGETYVEKEFINFEIVSEVNKRINYRNQRNSIK